MTDAHPRHTDSAATLKEVRSLTDKAEAGKDIHDELNSMSRSERLSIVKSMQKLNQEDVATKHLPALDFEYSKAFPFIGGDSDVTFIGRKDGYLGFDKTVYSVPMEPVESYATARDVEIVERIQRQHSADMARFIAAENAAGKVTTITGVKVVDTKN